MRVVIAPDSLKGTATASAAAHAIARGWLRGRPDDQIVMIPQADGGEGTCDVVAASIAGAVWQDVGMVPGPNSRPAHGRWLLLPGGEALVELAAVSGITLLDRLDPLGAHTRGLGALLARVIDEGVSRVSIALGGSASTDGGSGALAELGVKLLDRNGEPITDGGGALLDLVSADFSGAPAAPPGGIRILSDVESPLTGPTGAAAVFGPQKGATPHDIEILDRALERFVDVISGTPTLPGRETAGATAQLPSRGVVGRTANLPGAGAAGGTTFGLTCLWPDAQVVSGAREVARMTGLCDALAGADLVLTAEGSFDRSSLVGKAIGTIMELADHAHTRCAVIAGHITEEGKAVLVNRNEEGISLTDIAGGRDRAMAEPLVNLEKAAAAVARRPRRCHNM